MFYSKSMQFPSSKITTGYILFMDIVGYSLLLGAKQARTVETLKNIAEATDSILNIGERVRERGRGEGVNTNRTCMETPLPTLSPNPSPDNMTTQKPLIIPTGDGLALSFFDNPENPLKYAIEITKMLKHDDYMLDGAPIPLRMGIHAGPVYLVEDVRQQVAELPCWLSF